MKVAIIKDETLDYGRNAPFHPPERYPEYPFEDIDAENQCYGRVRELFYRLGMDRGNYDTPGWNPLGEVIKPGDSVLIKPNFVSHRAPKNGKEAIITQGPVIWAVLDYAYIALKGRGKLTIGDAPYIYTDFSKVVKDTGIDKVAGYYNEHGNIKVSVVDLRFEKGRLQLWRIKRQHFEGDPLGYSLVDLKNDSEHHGTGSYEMFRNSYYNWHDMAKHHTHGKHEYFIANSVLDADVIINIPKLKTHAKAGISCALKNIVGINGCKDIVPHHRAGSREEGGDEYLHKDLRKGFLIKLKDEIPAADNIFSIQLLRGLYFILYCSKFIKPFKGQYSAGGWYGNDTIPRTIVDLNKILFYADRKGAMSDIRQRKMFIVVDGIIAGEKEGPMANTAKKCGVLIAGYSPVAVDIVSCTVMGFDYTKIPTIKLAMGSQKYKIFDGDIESIEILADKCHSLEQVYDVFNCKLMPPEGWTGHIEYERNDVAKFVMDECKALEPSSLG